MKFFRQTLAAVLAFALLQPAGASAQEGKPFAERMLDWERANGRPSRLTLYAKIGTLRLPKMSVGLLASLREAAENPFVRPLPRNAPLADLSESYEPAFALMFAAWDVPGAESFERTSPLDPEPDIEAIVRAALLMCVRAQAHAARGNIDAALSDASTVWLAGHSLGQHEPTFPMALAGGQLRALGLRQIRAVLEVGGLDMDSGRLESLARIFLSNPPSQREPVALAARRDAALLLAWLREKSPKDHSLDIDFARKAVLEAFDPLAEPGPFFAKAEPLERLAPRVRGAMDTYPPLKRFPMPDAAEGAFREAWTDSLENVVVASVLALGAKKQFGGPPSPEQLASYAGPMVERLNDPFTGEALRIEISEETLLVRSAGPDREFALQPVWEFDRSLGAASDGDVILRSPWNLWHDRYARGRGLQTRQEVRGGSSPF